MLRRTALSTHVFSRSLSTYRPAVEAMVEVLGSLPGPHVEEARRNVGKMLSVRVIEALEPDDLRRLLVRAVALARERLPGAER